LARYGETRFGGSTSWHEEAAVQPAGGETEPRTPIANADALRGETTTVQDTWEIPERMAARVALTIARPTRLASKMGALLCSVIGNPLIRAIARLCPSARSAGFFAPRNLEAHRRTRHPGYALAVCATAGKQQPFSSADERGIRPFRDDARVIGHATKRP
jgi:hypothetical protein